MQHPKGILIERAKQLGLGKPSFDTHNTGPEHEPLFESVVTIRGTVYGEGEGGTKRDAERRASEEALETLAESRRERSPGSQPDAADAVASSRASSRVTSSLSSSPDEPFAGPWPIFAEVLASSLRVAHARVNPTLTGPNAIDEVQALALQLYKGTLENLGEIVEMDEAVID